MQRAPRQRETGRHTSGSTTSQASTVTILYSASQLGQLKGIGSDWFIAQKEQVLKMEAARTCLNTTHRPTTFAAPSLPLYAGSSAQVCAPASGHTDN
jgi:hypothetical protein